MEVLGGCRQCRHIVADTYAFRGFHKHAGVIGLACDTSDKGFLEDTWLIGVHLAYDIAEVLAVIAGLALIDACKEDVKNLRISYISMCAPLTSER